MDKQYICGLARYEEVASWVQMVKLIIDYFPGLDNPDVWQSYPKMLNEAIKNRSAICMRDGSKVIGILSFSKKENSIEQLGVHPNYRQKGIATEMFHLMLSEMGTDRNITVITYRDDDPKGIAARAFYRKCGFMPAKLSYVDNYPVQEMTLHPLKMD